MILSGPIWNGLLFDADLVTKLTEDLNKINEKSKN